jgi:hypothetical protein
VLETGKERIAKDLAEYSQSPARSGTLECPVVHRTVSGGAGQPPVVQDSLAAYGYNSPDYPVVHQTVR